MDAIRTVMLCAVTLLSIGCTSDPVGVTERTQIRTDADTVQVQAVAEARVDIAEQDRLARQAEAEEDSDARQAEAEQDRRAREAEANARVMIHKAWAALVAVALLAAFVGTVVAMYIRRLESPHSQPSPATQPVMIDGPTWRALEKEARGRGQRLELRDSALLLIDPTTETIVARREIAR